MANQNYTVYKHTTPDGKVYIGCTGQKLNDRWRGGKHYETNLVFTKAIEKFGWENVEHDILAKELTRSQAERLEEYYIEKYNSRDPDFGYNFHKGGGTNYEALSKIHKGGWYKPISVRCVETGEVFRTVTEAAQAKNSNQPNVTRSLKKRYRAGGVHWEAVKQ